MVQTLVQIRIVKKYHGFGLKMSAFRKYINENDNKEKDVNRNKIWGKKRFYIFQSGSLFMRKYFY